MKRSYLIIILIILSLFILNGCSDNKSDSVNESSYSKEEILRKNRLARDDWNEEVKNAVNDLLDLYGSQGETSESQFYAVFDFDNTCSIFDMEEQTVVYQLQTMAFEISPDEMKEILLTGIPDVLDDLSAYGLFEGSFDDIAGDISSAYKVLWEKYGPFTNNGVDNETRNLLKEDDYWKEFAVKILVMYDSIGEVCSHDIAYPWMTYLFKGMSEDELYGLATRAIREYGSVETSEVNWRTSDEIQSKTGNASYTWTSGVTVTENIKELWKVFDENGIDVWVCSASETGVIRAAIDYYGLHDNCRGLLAMTDKTDENGKLINEYDYDTGCGYYATDNGWEHMDRPTKSQTQGKGKVTAVVNAISPEYGGHGPIAGFMDSTGDFCFCTEFETLKLVVCFNRASRSVKEGGGLIAEIAVYQKDTLGFDLKKANEAGDTFYVLQGRDENGLRSFRNSRYTLIYGQTQEKLFKNEENFAQLEYFCKHRMSTEEIINNWAIKKSGEKSGLGFDTGFISEYDGYHSHQ